MTRTRVWGTLDPFLESGPVMGRGVANRGFLRALLAEGSFDAYHFFPADQATAATLKRALGDLAPDLANAGRIEILDRRELPRALASGRYQAFHLSDCVSHPAYLASLRNRHSPDIFPITSTTHSLSYARFIPAFLAHLWPGTTKRDAVVCTSAAGKRVLESCWERLSQGYGLDPDRFPAPGTPVIPLGVDARFIRPAEPQERRTLRNELGLPEAQVVFLVLGRLDHASKMDLVPVVRAFQRVLAAGLPREAVSLVLAGWTEDADPVPRSIAELSRNIGLACTLVERPPEALKLRLLRACDVVVSVADNLQETFGLTLLEAGAAGLPVIASDYDGYRDIIEHRVTGLLVPTLAPAETPDVDELAPLLFDTDAHLRLAQRTVVDVGRLAQSILDMVLEPVSRQDMGRAARRRVITRFAWPEVIKAHVSLWERLHATPMSAEDTARARGAIHPMLPHYGRDFAGHPTQSLDPSLRLVTTRTGQAVRRGLDHPVVYHGLTSSIEAGAARLLVELACRPVEASELARALASQHPGMTRDQALIHVLWALKQDLVEPAGS